MHAIEFTTDAEDGIIRIPKKYLKSLKKNIRVIILVEEKECITQEKKSAIISSDKNNR